VIVYLFIMMMGCKNRGRSSPQRERGPDLTVPKVPEDRGRHFCNEL